MMDWKDRLKNAKPRAIRIVSWFDDKRGNAGFKDHWVGVLNGAVVQYSHRPFYTKADAIHDARLFRDKCRETLKTQSEE